MTNTESTILNLYRVEILCEEETLATIEIPAADDWKARGAAITRLLTTGNIDFRSGSEIDYSVERIALSPEKIREQISSMDAHDLAAIIEGRTRLGAEQEEQLLAWNLAIDEEAER